MCLVHRSHFTRFALHIQPLILQIKILYLSVCEAKSVGLVRYPTTVALETGLLIVTHCADNSHADCPETVYSTCMIMMCLPNGIWQALQIPPQCQCDEGYHEASVDGRMICQGLLYNSMYSIFPTTLEIDVHIGCRLYRVTKRLTDFESEREMNASEAK